MAGGPLARSALWLACLMVVNGLKGSRLGIVRCCAPLVAQLRQQAAAGASALSLLPQCFPFELDQFQLDAMNALHEGSSVVLSAPTGSGKTAVAEIGLYAALARGERAIYTTPLKALSNQKFGDLQRILGREAVGLLTGDSQVNRDADVLVMTTEVYRNMLLEQEQMIFGSGSGRVGVVILDEFHYMNDRSRGTVWEECCILSPPSAKLVALSATMANARRVTQWLDDIHGPTTLIETDFRPVPLRYHYADDLGLARLFTSPNAGPGAGGARSPRAWKLNAALIPERRMAERERLYGVRSDSSDEFGRDTNQGSGRGGKSFKWSRRKSDDGAARGGADGQYGGGRTSRQRRPDSRQQARSEVPSMPMLLRDLARRKMLPAIVFIFSRAGCDSAAEAAAKMRSSLVSRSEQEAIDEHIASFKAANGVLLGSLEPRRFELLRLGIASHHAGMLPLEKSLVEQLFQRNLLKASASGRPQPASALLAKLPRTRSGGEGCLQCKSGILLYPNVAQVVFSTETLAAGINMPARTTVVTVLSKRGDRGIEALSASSLLQMAGRAGRRGQDDLGNVVICRSAFEAAPEAASLLRRPPDAIGSHFCVSYGSALKMRRVRPLHECEQLLRRSFGAYLARFAAEAASSRLDQVRAERARLAALLAAHPSEQIVAYAKLGGRLRAEQRSLEYLREQEAQADAELVAALLAFVPKGTPAMTADGAVAIIADDAPAPLIRKMRYQAAGDSRGNKRNSGGGSDGEITLLLVEDGTFRCAGVEHISALYPEEPAALSLEAQRLIADATPPLAEWVPQPDGSWSARPWGVEKGGARARSGALANDEDPASGVSDCARQASFDAARALDLEALRSLVPSLPQLQPSSAVLRQLARVERVEAQIVANPLHLEPQRDEILEAAERLEALQVEEAKLIRKAGRAAAGEEDARRHAHDSQETNELDLGALLGRQPAARTSSGGDEEDVLTQFRAVGEVLRQYGALDGASEDGWATTDFGKLVASLSGENELWLAIVLMEVAGGGELSPSQLAAVLAATLDERLRPNTFVSTVPSEQVYHTIEILSDRASTLQAAQFEAGLAFPVGLEAGVCGLVEAWAEGMDWGMLVGSTSLDLGDIYRLLRRSVDLLKQVSNVPYVSEDAKACARAAVRAMDRYPIADDVLMAMPEDVASNGVPEVSLISKSFTTDDELQARTA